MANLQALAAKIELLSPQALLLIAAELCDANKPEAAELIAEKAVEKLAAMRLFGKVW
jgi:hypothetical protein